MHTRDPGVAAFPPCHTAVPPSIIVTVAAWGRVALLCAGVSTMHSRPEGALWAGQALDVPVRNARTLLVAKLYLAFRNEKLNDRVIGY